MATILIKTNELTKNTIIGGNVDTDRFLPAVKIAQQTKIKKVLGQTLYNKVCDDFFNETLSGLYLEMYDDYVLPMVSHKSAEVYLSSGAYMVSNNGITKTKTDTSETISKEEVDYLVQASRNLYESYENDFMDWIKVNGVNIPEWVSDTGVINNNLVGSWFLKK